MLRAVSARTWLRRAVAAVAGLGFLLLALVGLLHTSPARAFVLQRVVLVASQRDVTLTADSLRYNLFTGQAILSKPVLASTHAAREPFFVADAIEVSLSTAVLFGGPIDRIRVDNAQLSFHWRADGTSNLPARGPAAGVSPSALRIDRIQVTPLAVSIMDDGSGLVAVLPDISVDVGPEDGDVRLRAAGQVRRGNTTAVVTALGGGVAFDGRAIHLKDFAVASGSAGVQIAGEIGLLVADPQLKLRVHAVAEGTDFAQWVGHDAVPNGVLRLEATVNGQLASPTVEARLRGDALSYRGVTVTGVDGDLRVDRERVEATRLEMSLAGGRLGAAGRLSLASGEANVTASWSDLDVARMATMIGGGLAPPAALATGRMAFAGRPSEARSWHVAVTNRLVAVPLRSPRHPAVEGTAVLRVDSGRWSVQGTHAVAGEAVRMAVRGALDPADIGGSTISGTIEAPDADLSRVLAALGTMGVIESVPPVTGELELSASLSGSISSPAMHLRASGRGLSGFDISGIDVDLDATGTLERTAVAGRIHQGGANVLEVTGTLRPREGRLEAAVTGTLGEIATLSRGAPVAGAADVRFDVRGPLQALAVGGSISTQELRYRGVALGPLAGQIALEGDAVRLELAAPAFATTAVANVRLGGSRPTVIDLTAREADIGRLLSAAGIEAGVSGTVSLAAHAEGTLAEWRRSAAAVEIDAFEGHAHQIALRLLEPARVRYDEGTLDVVALEAALGAARLSIGGQYALLDDAAAVAAPDALRGSLVGDVSHVVDALRAFGALDQDDLSGRGSVVVLARIGGSGERPDVSADVEIGPAEIASRRLPPLGDVRLSARVANGWAEVVSASAEWQQARVTVDGRVPLRLIHTYAPNLLLASTDATPGPASLNVRAASVTSNVLAPFLPPESIAQIEGALDATVNLEAPSLELARLRGEARLERLALAAAGVELTQAQPTRIVIENGIARVANWNWTGRGTTLTVQGEVRLPERRAALLAGGQLDLRLLTPFLAGADVSVAGALIPRVSIAGPLDDLRVEGDLAVTAGELRTRSPDVTITELSITASLDRERGHITRLDGQINGGTLTGTGELTYGGERPVAGSIDATIAGMGLAFPEGLRSEVDSALNLALLSQPDGWAGTIDGTVTVVRSAYREPIAVVGRLLDALRTERLAAAASTESTFADRLRLNVRLLTDGDLIVDNNLARLQMGGDLRVIGTIGGPALSGRATLREGGELFLGRNRYTIDSGSVDFANPSTIEPNLNVQARTRAGGEDIELTLKGTPETLSVDLRSTTDAQLGQADIASLLLTGRPLSEVSGAEAEIVGEQVLGYLSGDVLGAASRVVGLDTIRLGGVDSSLRRRTSADIASETDPTSRLTFGKSLGDSVEVTLSQSLRDGGAQTWVLDYTPIPRLDLRLVSDDENLRSYQFRHDVTIGDPRRRPRATSSAARAEQRVTRVVITGELAGPEARLYRLVQLEPGEVFDFSGWQRDRDRLERGLHDEGRLEARVSARRQDGPSGVALEYQVEAGPSTSIRVTGYTAPGDTIRAIEQAWTRAVFDDALEDEVEELVARTLRERGYLEPSVTATVTMDRDKRLDVVVDPGDRVLDRRIVVSAGDDALARDLERWAGSRGIEDAAWREPSTFRRAVVDELRRRGHASPEVVVRPPQIEGRFGVVRVEVHAGPAMAIGAVAFDGATAVSADRLHEAADLEPGAVYDPAAVARARDDIARLLRGEGFARSQVDVHAAAAGGSNMSVDFRIVEGPRQILREVVVTGNRAIDREVVIRALGLDIGDPLGVDAWLPARARLFETALFRRVDVVAESVGDGSGSEQPMRLVATVEEWPALRIRYGVQVSEERPETDVEGRALTPGLSADLTRRTLFGRAISVGVAAEYERRERRARGFLNAPALFGRRIESLFTLERSRGEIPEASVMTDRSGVSLEQRIPVGTLRLSYGYRYDRDHTFSTRPSDDPLNPTFDETVDVARLTGSAVFDTRNDPLQTTRGWLVSSSLEYAPASLGSDIRFVRYLGQAYRFQPWGPVVLASAARLGLATALGGQTLIPSERFFAGGARTVRGVGEDGLGPRDFFGDATGGGALTVFNQEVRVPVYRWFGAVGFVDVGNVFAGPRALTLGNLVTSFGTGLRVATPFALVRADVARLRSPQAGQPSTRWTIGIGHTF